MSHLYPWQYPGATPNGVNPVPPPVGGMQRTFHTGVDLLATIDHRVAARCALVEENLRVQMTHELQTCNAISLDEMRKEVRQSREQQSEDVASASKQSLESDDALHGHLKIIYENLSGTMDDLGRRMDRMEHSLAEGITRASQDASETASSSLLRSLELRFDAFTELLKDMQATNAKGARRKLTLSYTLIPIIRNRVQRTSL